MILDNLINIILLMKFKKWTKIVNILIKYKWKIIYFKDLLSIISMKFVDFPNSFCLEYGVKEIFTYSYYTLECIKKLNNKWIITE